MKELLTLLFALCAIGLQAQIPERAHWLEARYKGDLYATRVDSGNLAKLIDADCTISTDDIYFDPISEHLVFSRIHLKPVEVPDDPWGLADYCWVHEIRMKWDGEMMRTQSVQLLLEPQELMTWWQSHMITYEAPDFGRKEAADKYTLIPPPPPPPQEESWKYP